MQVINDKSKVSWSLAEEITHPGGNPACNVIASGKEAELQGMLATAKLRGIEFLDLRQAPFEYRICSKLDTTDQEAAGVTYQNDLHLDAIDGRPADFEDYKRVAELLDLEVLGDVPSLDELRRCVADRIFEDADLGTWSVAGTGGWEDDGEDRLVSSVFLEMPKGPSLKMQFAVEFEPGFSSPVDDEGEFDLPKNPAGLYGFYVNADERGEFNADVRNCLGETVYEIHSDETGAIDLIEDGFISAKDDLDRLSSHLRGLRVLPRGASIMPAAEFEEALPEFEEDEMASPEI